MDEELKKKMDKEYDKHTKIDDGHFKYCYPSSVNEVYNQILERDFIDEICKENEDEV